MTKKQDVYNARNRVGARIDYAYFEDDKMDQLLVDVILPGGKKYGGYLPKMRRR